MADDTTAPKKTINKATAIYMILVLAILGSLAAWGDRLGMSPGALHWIQAAAGAVGVVIMSILPKLVSDLSDRVLASLEQTTTTTTTVQATTAEKK